MPAFARTIGIDYSGAETPTASLKGLRVYLAEREAPPVDSSHGTAGSRGPMPITGTSRSGSDVSVVLHQLFHRTMLYAFAHLRRGAIFGAGLLWFSACITPIRANITGPSVSATKPIAETRKHAGIVIAKRYSFEMR